MGSGLSYRDRSRYPLELLVPLLVWSNLCEEKLDDICYGLAHCLSFLRLSLIQFIFLIE